MIIITDVKLLEVSENIHKVFQHPYEKIKCCVDGEKRFENTLKIQEEIIRGIEYKTPNGKNILLVLQKKFKNYLEYNLKQLKNYIKQLKDIE